MADWVAIRIEVEEQGRSIRSVARDHKIDEKAIRKERNAGWPRADCGPTRTADQRGLRTNADPDAARPIPGTAEVTEGLTPQQRLFVAEYLIDRDAKHAAIRAGYSERSAKQIGSRLIANKDIAAAIAAAMDAQLKRIDVTADEIARRWWELANVDVNELVEHRRVACKKCWPEDGKGSPSNPDPNPDCTECAGDGVGKIHIHDSRALKGAARRLYRGVQLGKEGIKVLMSDQDAALVNIAKYFGMFDAKNEDPNAPLRVVIEGGLPD